ncbi:hypothetical protein H2200_011189 [Cladophialophora chaetospira]|uniref:Uncharacterized protein n=1 Tax=Cladophialophora chaetospira TaxID=386627 RepID=A0AA39CDI4_9EURO|nr:hypothetical protein H2200_011189 [Cladophialophora chaetospira]
MPHKHKRKPASTDTASYDLPPTSRARPLSIHKKADSIFTSDIERKRKYEARKQKKDQKRDQYKEDDTPKAFRRLMAFQEGKRVRNGLDDGSAPARKKRKVNGRSTTEALATSTSMPSDTNTTTAATTSEPLPSTTLKISPHESLSTFSQRVDQSLPLTSIPKHKSTKLNTITGLEKIKTPLTKHNKRLARMQKEWRATEQKLKDKNEELDDELAEKREESEMIWLGAGVDPSNPLASRKRKRKGGGVAGKDVDDADPWKVLEKKRREEGELRQKSLQDVVTAPPVLKPLKNIFREKRPDGHLRSGVVA